MYSFFSRAVTAMVLDVGYGYQVEGQNDLFVHFADVAAKDFEASVMAGAFLVDTIPWCEFEPSADSTSFLTATVQCGTFHHGSPGPVSSAAQRRCVGTVTILLTHLLIWRAHKRYGFLKQ
jgi:hypothetical protein